MVVRTTLPSSGVDGTACAGGRWTGPSTARYTLVGTKFRQKLRSRCALIPNRAAFHQERLPRDTTHLLS